MIDDLIELIKIKGGTFLMGSPENDPERFDDEGPQRLVTVCSFLMGKYPVTQAQWRFVTGLPKVERDLNADPAYFKGDDLPVEQVSWYEAVEFCQRLSKKTGREYRLPSEAQWEYACRADTTTPYSFGEKLTKEQAKFSANGTSEVGSFPANAFGLSDMHGNVYEWCQDHWHDNYDGAPSNGSAWLTDSEEAGCVLRGGSWIDVPMACRSACRLNSSPDFRSHYFGFRVVCSANG